MESKNCKSEIENVKNTTVSKYNFLIQSQCHRNTRLYSNYIHVNIFKEHIFAILKENCLEEGKEETWKAESPVGVRKESWYLKIEKLLRNIF